MHSIEHFNDVPLANSLKLLSAPRIQECFFLSLPFISIQHPNNIENKNWNGVPTRRSVYLWSLWWIRFGMFKSIFHFGKFETTSNKLATRILQNCKIVIMESATSFVWILTWALVSLYLVDLRGTQAGRQADSAAGNQLKFISFETTKKKKQNNFILHLTLIHQSVISSPTYTTFSARRSRHTT